MRRVLLVVASGVLAFVLSLLGAVLVGGDSGPTEHEREQARLRAEIRCSYLNVSRYSDEFINCVRVETRRNLD